MQAMIRRMRGDIEDKVHRLPLDYFDRQPRGDRSGHHQRHR
ncbi:MAG: hypothetical protein R2709_13915 [Marmoricola sp.]